MQFDKFHESAQLYIWTCPSRILHLNIIVVSVKPICTKKKYEAPPHEHPTLASKKKQNDEGLERITVMFVV